jgi:hypothetical protein
MTIQELYETTIKPLPVGDRVQLAKMIMDDIPPQELIAFSEEGTDEERRQAKPDPEDVV